MRVRGEQRGGSERKAGKAEASVITYLQVLGEGPVHSDGSAPVACGLPACNVLLALCGARPCGED